MHKHLLFFVCMSIAFSAQAQLFTFGQTDQSSLTTTSFRLKYTTNPSSTPVQTLVKYGLTTALELGYVTNNETTTNHDITLTGLNPGEVYFVKACLINGGDTTESLTTNAFATMSNSTHEIKVFFNGSIDNSVSDGTFPDISNSPAAIQAELIKRIDSAQTSIDVCVYNNNTSAIVTALTNAHNRGVTVRYVANDANTANTALNPAPAFPVLYVNTVDLMHNKFMIVDADAVNGSWVWTGSMNWTTNNINNDYNNVVLIQDQSMARGYTIEFEEMWGSSTATANATNSRAGSQKLDNTPHLYKVGTTMIQSFFSPSDNTTNHIEAAIHSAGGDVQFATLSFTQDELSAAIIARHNSGESVKGIIESIGDQGEEYTTMTNAGVDVLSHQGTQHDLHHKYCIVDANSPGSDPLVITGSHNWSSGAEERNDENTLIIHNAEIANWFLQEFSARYCEVAGGSTCSVDPAVAVTTQANSSFTAQVFPNPAAQQAQLSINSELGEVSLQIQVVNILGQPVYQQNINNLNGTALIDLPVGDWPAGQYFIRLENSRGEKGAARLTVLH